MRKILAVFLTLFLFQAAASVSSVHAAADTERWVCLTSQHCLTDGVCSAKHNKNGHVAKLSAKSGYEPIAGADTYVVVCIATDNDQICTTGNATSDMKVYGKSNYDTLRTQYGYAFEGLFLADGTSTVSNPAVWNGPYEWGDSLPTGHMHKWLALNYYDPNKFAVGTGGGQQQGTFNFETAEKDCVKIGWDPYGRVFDSQTLEPITNASVTLFFRDPPRTGEFRQMRAIDVAGGNLTNPQNTLADGNFSFVVPPNDYKLTVGAPPGGIPLTVVTDITQVDNNYSKAYFDIYPSTTGEVIHQAGAVEHRDIPVVSVGANTAPKMMEYFYSADSQGNVTVTGRVSHPLSKLFAHTSKVSTADKNAPPVPYRTLPSSYEADKWGKFAITIDQSEFESTDDYLEIFSGLEIQKVDLRDNTVTMKDGNWLKKLADAFWKIVQPVVQAQTTTTMVKFEPIPQFLAGYAYDASGKAIPNAKVGVYLTFSNKPYAQTTADANGYFVFNPSQLPNYAYTIKYTTPAGAVVNTTTSTFLAQNQKYISENKVDPYVVSEAGNQAVLAKAGVPTTAPAPATAGKSSSLAAGSKNTGTRGGSGGTTTAGTNTSSGVTAAAPGAGISNPILLVVLLLVVLIGGVGAGIVLYMKNKQPTVPPPQW